MVVSSGRFVTCHYCGRRFPEGDCRGWHCSTQCREDDNKRRAEMEQKIKNELNKSKPDPQPMYYI